MIFPFLIEDINQGSTHKEKINLLKSTLKQLNYLLIYFISLNNIFYELLYK